MAANYWLKLYYEMLDDPKVARLPDSSYRRFIECLLLAGETDSGGLLPSIEDMSWRLRLSETALSQDMSRLAMAGIVELRQHDQGERWFVTKFAARQAAVSGAERVKRHRERNKKRGYNAPGNDSVTKGYTDIDIDIDTDKDTYSAHTTPPRPVEQIPEPVHKMITALSAVSKSTFWAKTEDDFIDAAYALIGMDATPEQVGGFLAWWDKNPQYPGKPALKSIMTNWKSYIGGVVYTPAQSGNTRYQAPEPDRKSVV
jgi:DNA-binding transcriptional ArsR family regulator